MIIARFLELFPLLPTVEYIFYFFFFLLERRIVRGRGGGRTRRTRTAQPRRHGNRGGACTGIFILQDG